MKRVFADFASLGMCRFCVAPMSIGAYWTKCSFDTWMIGMEHEDFPPRTSCLGHARTTGYRWHSERLRWHVMWVFLLFVTFPGCGGCGGGNASPTMDPTKPWAGLGSKEAYEKWRAEQEAADAEKEKKLAVSQPKEPPRQVTNHQPAAAPNPAAPNEAVVEIENDPKTPTLPPLPATPRNVAHWSERDFIVARLRQQPTLSSAIERLGAQGKDDETAVRILTKLLQPGLFAELLDLAVGEPPKSEPAYSDEVIRSAVDALGRNGTPAARNVLGQLIIGRLATENNLLAASQALATLAAHPSPDHEEMLVRVATDAEVLAASGTSGLSAEALRQQALTLISQNADSNVAHADRQDACVQIPLHRASRGFRKTGLRGSPGEFRCPVGTLSCASRYHFFSRFHRTSIRNV